MKKKIIIIASALLACALCAVCVLSFNQKNSAAQNETIASSSAEQTEQKSEITTEEKANTEETQSAPAVKTTAADKKVTQGKTTTKPAAKEEITAAPTEPPRKTVSVTVTISCKNAQKYDDALPSYFANGEGYTADKGATALDAFNEICTKNNLAVEKRGNYIVSIGGLREKQFNQSSGWVYTVNGALANKPMNKYALKDGDKIEIYYVTSPSDKA